MRKTLVVLTVLVLSLALMLGCAQPSPTPTPKPTPTPTPSPSPKPSPTATPTPTAPTETAAEFFKKNHVNLIIPFGPGGGTDFYGRVLAAYWPDATGGNTMIVRNIPGGGTLLGTNQAYASKLDGLTLAATPSGTSLMWPVLSKDPAVKFDLSKINWLGNIPYAPVGFAVGAKLPYKDMADLQKVSGLKFGSIEGTPSQGLALVIELFGLKDASVIIGYKAGPEAALAVARNEIQGTAFSIGSIKTYVDGGMTKEPFLTLDFKRANLYPNTPCVTDLLKLSPENERLLRLFTILHGGLSVWAPPGVPADRLQYLRESFDKLVALAGVQTNLKERAGMWADPLNAKALADQVQGVLAYPPADIARFKQVTEKYTK